MNEFNKKKIEFKKSISFPCSYLAGKTERRLYVNLNKNENNKLLISELTKNGFRRSHEHMYIPVCEGCNACIPSRINIKDFKFSKSNLRVIKFNSDLSFCLNRSIGFSSPSTSKCQKVQPLHAGAPCRRCSGAQRYLRFHVLSESKGERRKWKKASGTPSREGITVQKTA